MTGRFGLPTRVYVPLYVCMQGQGPACKASDIVVVDPAGAWIDGWRKVGLGFCAHCVCV